MKLTNKLSLGTAQFGLDYGISNKHGQVNNTEARQILHYAKKSGIQFIDTAQSYGNSEEVIGKSNYNLKFNITTKIAPKNVLGIKESISESLFRLKTSKIDTVLYHGFHSFIDNRDSIQQLIKLKTEKIIKKMGFSLYYPGELEKLFNENINFDVVQIPFNIYDQRFKPYFKSLKEKEIEIQVRSVFLQGLFFIPPEKLHYHFNLIKEKHSLLYKISNELNIGVNEICLAFVYSIPEINNIILGIDSLENLKQNLKVDLDNALYKIDNAFFETLKVDDENILIPSKWKT